MIPTLHLPSYGPCLLDLIDYLIPIDLVPVTVLSSFHPHLSVHYLTIASNHSFMELFCFLYLSNVKVVLSQ